MERVVERLIEFCHFLIANDDMRVWRKKPGATIWRFVTHLHPNAEEALVVPWRRTLLMTGLVPPRGVQSTAESRQMKHYQSRLLISMAAIIAFWARQARSHPWRGSPARMVYTYNRRENNKSHLWVFWLQLLLFLTDIRKNLSSFTVDLWCAVPENRFLCL